MHSTASATQAPRRPAPISSNINKAAAKTSTSTSTSTSVNNRSSTTGTGSTNTSTSTSNSTRTDAAISSDTTATVTAPASTTRSKPSTSLSIAPGPATDATTRNSFASTATPNNYLHSHRHTNSSSSKLPASRSAHSKRDSLTVLSNKKPSASRNPPTVSPDPDHQIRQHNATQDPSPSVRHRTTHNRTRVSVKQSLDESRLAKSRTTTVQSSAAAAAAAAAPATSTPPSTTRTRPEHPNVKRSISLDSPINPTDKGKPAEKPASVVVHSPPNSAETIKAARPQLNRATTSRSSVSSHAPVTATFPERLITHGLSPASGTQSAPASAVSKDWPQGQQDLVSKSAQKTTSDERRDSLVKRPPISYNPTTNARPSGGNAPIPSNRAFRSTSSRQNLSLDMNSQSPRAYPVRNSYGDSNHRDRTLRALEGRQDYGQLITPPSSGGAQADLDDSGDVFLKIAREDVSRRGADEDNGYSDSQSAVSRLTRGSRRPFSAAIPSYQAPSSPPQVSRRLSDLESSRRRGSSDDQAGEKISRSITFRGVSREQTPNEAKPKTSSQLRASPLAPRSSAPDVSSEQLSTVVNYNRRRQPSVDGGSAMSSRMNSLKQSNFGFSNGRTYNSSPLAPKSADAQKQEFHGDGAHGPEGTDSTASTAAPSTMWDELDDLKSRIHRLELTGKLPPTSGAAISRASEERPPTANTNATTMSASPKRGSGGASQAGDVTIVPTTQKETHPILHSALAKSKQFLSPEVYNALEAASNDALNLSSLMGTTGQPGPISSATSSVGGGPVVTDRQLRRKADGICRSLTELCLALSERAAQVDTTQPFIAQSIEKSPLTTSPTITKFTFTGVPTLRQPSAPAERSYTSLGSPKAPSRPANSNTDRIFSVISSPKAAPSQRQAGSVVNSPKAVSRLDERRQSIFSNALPSPRFAPASASAALAAAVNSPTEQQYPTAGRKSSLLLARTRRAQTEEPEDFRKPSMLRTRRAGTEEPEESLERKNSVFGRSRRGTIENTTEEEDPRFRASSRVTPENYAPQSRMREYPSQAPQPPSHESNSLSSSALPRRRLASSGFNTRLVQPSSSSGLTARRYIERTTPDRETFAQDRFTEERDQRRFSLQQNPPVSRTASLKRSSRSSMIGLNSAAAQSNYR